MTRNVVSLFSSVLRPRNWSNQELAEFYRVEASLTRVGMSVDTEQGLSDEGDPWFVFCRADTHDVIIHFARIDGEYVVASPAFGSCSRGRDFRSLIEALIDQHPVVVPKDRSKGKLFIHPAALLVALVATCFFKVCQSDAVAGELRDGHAHGPILGAAARAFSGSESQSSAQSLVLEEQAAAALIAAVAVAVEWQQLAGPDHVDGHLPATAALTVTPVKPVEIALLDMTHDTVSSLHTGTSAADASLLPADATLGSATLIAAPVQPQQDTQPSAKGVEDNQIPVLTDPIQSAAQSPISQDQAPQANAPLVADHGTQGSSSTDHSSAPVAPVQAASMVEVQSVLGGLLQSHLQTNPQDPEQQFVLSVANNTLPQAATPADHQSVTPINATTSNTQTSSPPPVETPVTAVNNQPTTAPAVTPAVSGSTPDTVDGAILNFMTEHSNFQVIRQGNEVIIYDPALTPSNVQYSQQETFSFADGSTLMLIGLPAHTSDASWS